MNTACSTDAIAKTIKVNSAPVADAGADKTICLKSLDAPFNVSFDGSRSSDPDKDTLSYMWSFGDGNSAEGARVNHVYSKGGTYTATLTVDDGSGSPCSSSSDTVAVDLNRSPIADAGESKSACAGEQVSFDGTSSVSEAGTALSYRWSFGDGETATGSRVNHVYNKGGKHNVILTVDDQRGTDCSTASDSIIVDINSRPAVELADVQERCLGKAVNLVASASDPDGDKLAYNWDFGDGGTAQGSAHVTHTYARGGNYTVSVTVDDGKNSPCSVASDAVNVKINTPPSAKMSITKACCVGMEQRFDASGSSDADGDAITYKWNFGDGSTAEGRSVTHVYNEPGNFKVTLIVDDNTGTECSMGVATDSIVVNASPVPVIKVR